MAFNISEMRQKLKYGGARNTQFRVTLTNPVDGSADALVPFMVQAASLPEWMLGVIQVPYFGRFIKLAGDRVFAPWQVEVINDENFPIRNAIETWNNAINSLEGNIRNLPSSQASHYQSTAVVEQLSKTGKVVRAYEFEALWPSQVGAIQLGWSDTDQIEVFPVVFEYDSFRVVKGPTGDAGGV
jgi:hypothetical protein